VLILTDGQVAGTEQILAQARAAHIRLSCLGIGSASQDRFLSLLARETGGVSRLVTPRERVDLAAVDLFASIGRPVASGLKASGNIQPEPPSAVFAGTPALLFGQTEGDPGAVELTWNGGQLSLPLPSGDAETGQTVRLLQGSRLITDWESRYPAEEALAPLEKRQQSRVGARLRILSQTFGWPAARCPCGGGETRGRSFRCAAGDPCGAGRHPAGRQFSRLFRRFGSDVLDGVA